MSDFGHYLQHPDNRKQLDFKLKEGGYDTVDHQATDPSKLKPSHDMRNRRVRVSPAEAQFYQKIVAAGALAGW